MVRGTDAEPLYNSLVHYHHYLGYRQIVGNHLKYIAYIGERPVACLGWGSAAWSVKSRDAFIGWDKKTKEERLQFVANNTRFLVLPWVQVKCLASKIMNSQQFFLPSPRFSTTFCRSRTSGQQRHDRSRQKTDLLNLLGSDKKNPNSKVSLFQSQGGQN